MSILSVAACSSKSPPEPLPIENLSKASHAVATQISKAPLLYSLSIQHEGSSYSLFGTGLKECEVREFIPSRATTRELLVGFEQIQVTAQGFAEQNGKRIYRSEITARLDDQPIEMVSYTFRDLDCVSDFAFWREQQASQNQPSLRALLETSVLKDITSHD